MSISVPISVDLGQILKFRSNVNNLSKILKVWSNFNNLSQILKFRLNFNNLGKIIVGFVSNWRISTCASLLWRAVPLQTFLLVSNKCVSLIV